MYWRLWKNVSVSRNQLEACLAAEGACYTANPSGCSGDIQEWATPRVEGEEEG